MTTITIHTTRDSDGVADELGVRHTYTMHNARGEGRYLATIEGSAELVDVGYGCHHVALPDGSQWVLREALALARRGERGLRVVGGR